MIKKGYDRYRSSSFKLLIGTNWSIIVSNDKLIEELHHISDNTLSLLHAVKNLTRYLDYLVRETMKEMLIAMDSWLGMQSNIWIEIGALDKISTIFAQTFNCVLVGTEICRREDYITISSNFAINIAITSSILNILPYFLRPIVGPIITKLPKTLKGAMTHLKPEIERRQRLMEEYGNNWQDKPIDILTWLIEAAEGPEKEAKALATRVLVINAATIHTSSNYRTQTFTHALFNLATHPDFFKESMRMNGLGSMGFPRKALKSFTFSDGAYTPKGFYVSAPFSVHFDERFYPNAHTFEGFQFMQVDNPDDTTNNLVGAGMANTNAHFLLFGHGKHAW
ncbi:cytochrome P450 [Obba rivulosa]|uniref:Cytochrome P450 n=1 Tax=Obba rivulosa TaxID=1052685 RepID=A0A8E2AJG3_9APHY|nr:cytochrome P450 [Obba rivulosa]